MLIQRLGQTLIGLIVLASCAILWNRSDDQVQEQPVPATLTQGPAAAPSAKRDREVATGFVFDDRNGNGQRDPDEPGMAKVGVSNGQVVVQTDEQGRYEVPVSNDTIIFVIKPSGWRTPLSSTQLPQFFYIHKPKGSPKSKYPGVAPTGELPQSIDFPLTKQKEPQQFKALMFGDPQPRNQQEIDYIAHDVIEDLVGTDAAFGVTLGDIMFDNLSLFESGAKTVALLGIPWYNVIGNHDVNREAKEDHLSDETFERNFGPTYYSFDYGPAHFIVMDNIDWTVKDNGKSGYQGGFGKQQLQFVKNDLAFVPKEKLVVLMMHIPIIGTIDRKELYRLIEDRPFTMSISGHTHHHEHRFIGKEDGWNGEKPHHHVINVTVSGSWWSGAKDERGIPHTIMSDGAPNGYSILSVDENKYRVDFRAAGRSKDYQMSVDAPDAIPQAEARDTIISVNFFNGSPQSKVDMRVGAGDWKEMKRKVIPDPSFVRLALREKKQNPDGKKWRHLPRAKACPHLWQASLPELKPGTYSISIRAKDRHGRLYQTHRVVRVTE